MAEVEFIYNGDNIIIHCNKNHTMKDIFKKFINKSKVEKNSIIFLYNGDKIIEELTLENTIKDKNINKIKILVELINDNKKRKNIIKSKNIICPECKENIRIKIEDYKINLFGCKNNHIIENILLENYENTQNIDISKIICEICKENNKGNSDQNAFYRCNKCKINICPLCYSKHDKNHKIINYELKDYICEEHNEAFVEYCVKCKKDICLSCENNHINHETIFYKNIIRDVNKVKTDINEYKKEIDQFVNYIDNIIKKLIKVKLNIKIYYNIYNNMMKNNDEVKNDINEYKKDIDIFYNNLDDIINQLNRVKENIKVYYNIYNNIII